MKQIILSIFTAVVVLHTTAQTKPRNSIGLNLGWQNFSMVDKHSSPLRYSTNSLFPKLGLFYSKQTAHSILHVQVDASKGTIHPSRFGERHYKAVWSATDSFQYSLASQFIHADIEASYLRNLSSLSAEKFDYWVGGTVNEAAYYGDQVAASDWLLNVADLAPAFQVNYLPLRQHSLTFRVDLSVLGVITRPVYALFPKSNKDKNVPAYFKQGTEVASLNKFQKVNFQVGYHYQVGRHFSAGVLYRLRWLHFTQPKEIRAVDKQFDIKLSYTY